MKAYRFQEHHASIMFAKDRVRVEWRYLGSRPSLGRQHKRHIDNFHFPSNGSLIYHVLQLLFVRA